MIRHVALLKRPRALSENGTYGSLQSFLIKSGLAPENLLNAENGGADAS
jgi:hypothetical protein